eukprot:750937-Hanusia_phi.AAC.1
MLGTLCRIYLDVLFFDVLNITSPSGALFLDWPANIVGSWLVGVVLGLCTELVEEVPLIANFVEYGPQLQVGLQTGFCGCITTYASWNHQMVSIAVLSGSQLCVSVAGYVLGLHSIMASYSVGVHNARLVALYLGCTRLAAKHREIGSSRTWTQTAGRPYPHRELPEIVSLSRSRRIWTRCVAFLFVGSLAASIAGWITDTEARKGYWAAVALSPVGALARWQLGKLYNKRIRFNGENAPFFPLGCPFLQSLIAAILTDSATQLSVSTLAACSGISTGLLGSMSTGKTIKKKRLRTVSCGAVWKRGWRREEMSRKSSSSTDYHAASTFAAEISKLLEFSPTDRNALGTTGYYGYLYASLSIFTPRPDLCSSQSLVRGGRLRLECMVNSSRIVLAHHLVERNREEDRGQVGKVIYISQANQVKVKLINSEPEDILSHTTRAVASYLPAKTTGNSLRQHETEDRWVRGPKPERTVGEGAEVRRENVRRASDLSPLSGPRRSADCSALDIRQPSSLPAGRSHPAPPRQRYRNTARITQSSTMKISIAPKCCLLFSD